MATLFVAVDVTMLLIVVLMMTACMRWLRLRY